MPALALVYAAEKVIPPMAHPAAVTRVLPFVPAWLVPSPELMVSCEFKQLLLKSNDILLKSVLSAV